MLRQVCLAAVGLVCDLCRALMSNILPYCDELMQLLLENLGVRTASVHVLPLACSGTCKSRLASFTRFLHTGPVVDAFPSTSSQRSLTFLSMWPVCRTRTSIGR